MLCHQSICCRLCINICKGPRSLYDETGQANETHELMTRYFTAAMLNMEWDQHLTHICETCWRHIVEFQDFQQSVILAQKINRLNFTGQKMMDTKDFIMEQDAGGVVEHGPNKIIIQSENEIQEILTAELPPAGPYNNEESTRAINKFEIESSGVNMAKQSELASDIPVETEASLLMHAEIPTTTISADNDCFLNSVQPITVEKYESESFIVTDGKGSLRESFNSSNILLDNQSKSVKQECSPLRDPQILDEDSLHLMSENSCDLTKDMDEELSSDDNYMNTAGPTNNQMKQHSKRSRRGKPKDPKTIAEYECAIGQWRPVLECFVCKLQMSSFSLLQQHFKQHHPIEDCHIVCCQRKLHYHYEIKRHIEYHQAPQKLRCDECLISFSRQYVLNCHLRNKHSSKYAKSKPFQCSSCKAGFSYHNSLQRHLKDNKCRNHSPQNREYVNSLKDRTYKMNILHRCSICGKAFITRAGLRKNMSRRHSQESITNNSLTWEMGEGETNSSTDTADEVQDEVESDEQHEEEYDELSLSYLESMKPLTLQIKGHRHQNYDRLIALWRSSLECVICGTTLGTFTQLQQHFSQHHNKEQCHILCCQLKLHFRFEIEQHIHYHYAADDEHKCDMCYASLSATDKTYHVRKVHGARSNKYRCQPCERTFINRSYLAEHQYRMHPVAGRKYFDCSICDKSFTCYNSVYQHIALHKDINFCRCEYCHKVFTQRATLFKHMRRFHGLEMEQQRRTENHSESVGGIPTTNKSLPHNELNQKIFKKETPEKDQELNEFCIKIQNEPISDVFISSSAHENKLELKDTSQIQLNSITDARHQPVKMKTAFVRLERLPKAILNAYGFD